MASTEDWIEWSRAIAQPYWHTNHQMFLEVAGAACRHYRDHGMSTVPELANADHYWFARWLCFAGSGGAGDIAATPFSVLSDSLAELVGRAASYTGHAAAGVAVMGMSVLWDGLKRLLIACDLGGLIPGGGRASEPSVEQLEWAARGWLDGMALDAPYAEDMRWRFVLTELPGTLRLPPPPR